LSVGLDAIGPEKAGTAVDSDSTLKPLTVASLRVLIAYV
jgi:hypothetical protein